MGLLRAQLSVGRTGRSEGPDGQTICAGFDHEFSLSGASYTPSLGLSLAALLQKNGYLTDLESALTGAGVTAQTIGSEYGSGQYEKGLRTADACLIARGTIREVSRRNGLQASFTPMPARDAVGYGAHIHLSLVQPDGTNVPWDLAGPMQLGAVATQFSASILAHVDALLAITAPPPVSCFRLGPALLGHVLPRHRPDTAPAGRGTACRRRLIEAYRVRGLATRGAGSGWKTRC